MKSLTNKVRFAFSFPPPPGYHIFAAAVVSHFDHDWGKTFFERVLLLIRNIANPSEDDNFFPMWRHKDWYQGHSWASGIARPPYTNGRNQESSSEAIAAYEAIGLYGQVMASIIPFFRVAYGFFFIISFHCFYSCTG